MKGMGSSRKGTATKAAISSVNWILLCSGEKHSFVWMPVAGSKGCSVSHVPSAVSLASVPRVPSAASLARVLAGKAAWFFCGHADAALEGRTSLAFARPATAASGAGGGGVAGAGGGAAAVAGGETTTGGGFEVVDAHAVRAAVALRAATRATGARGRSASIRPTSE